MARLILNADDFGLTQGVNRAIAELAQQQALTSATLMACGKAFDDAVSIALQTPSLGVGCHVVLIDGQATAPAADVASLLQNVSPLPLFRISLARFGAAAQGGRIQPGHIEAEAKAQIRKLQSAGIRVTHVDTHKHTHMFPSVTGAVLNAAYACGVRAVRNPFEPAWCAAIAGSATRKATVNLLRRTFEPFFRAHPLITSGRIATTDGSLGVSATGSLNRESLKRILGVLPEGTWELVTHPGYRDADLDAANTRLLDERNEEREALLAEVKASGHTLINFADLATS